MKYLYAFLLSFFLNVMAMGTPVDDNGFLKVNGSQLVNQYGSPIQLKGMSSHGIQWFGQFLNYDSLKWLRDDWGIKVIRVAMYLNEGGYLSRPALKSKMIETVNHAIELGLYVIIDWHILSEKDPNVLKKEALVFFAEMATMYKDYPNVLYEIANEPNNTTWNYNIKPYSEELIQKIRSIDVSNIIIVGTSNWSQGVDEAANNPLSPSYSNIMYACHFYAGSHGQWLRDKVDYAMSRNLAIFVTEWGVTNHTGNGTIYLKEAKEWVTFLNQRKISWTNWSLSDHHESSAVLKPGANPSGHWPISSIKESGMFLKSVME